MEALEVIIEVALNSKLEFIHYYNVSVQDAMKQLKKQHGNLIIYNIKTKY